jgi:serine/threonine-protein kinase
VSDERLPELFDEASALDAEGRRRLLEQLRREEPALADELARLLEAPDSAPSPIDAAPVGPPIGENETPPPPEQVGPYRLVREIGRGGMGRVYLAEQVTPDFSRTVALKLIHNPGPDPESVRRFRDEVRILASLEHPWIVRFLDGGRSPEGIWFLALEYVEGDDLVTHARRQGLDVEARVRLFAAVTEAVAWAHERGVVHRDLKPGNVLVGRDGRPRLLDFGISKLLDPGRGGELTTTAHGARRMTPAYASPEQLAGRTVTPASDVYSLGVILYELLAGRRPETSGTAAPEPPSTAARRAAATTGGAAPPAGRATGPRISRDLDAICLKALQHEPNARYAGAAALLADLHRYLDGKPVAARQRSPAARWRENRRALAALLLLVAVGSAVLWWRSSQGTRSPAPPAAPAVFPFDPSNPPPAEQSERRLAEAPDDVVAAAALALRLARDHRTEEARLVVGRMRQIPGSEGEPLTDYAEGRIASVDGEEQRALVFYTRARDRALAAGRRELLGTIRTSRAATLSKLGQRDASRQELELARADSEAIGDHRTLYRTLNGLALEHLQRAEMEPGVAALEAALAAADAAGIEPLVTLENLSVVHAIQGRPDLGEPLGRRLLDHYHRAGQPVDEAEVSKNLALLLRDLGRTDESAEMLDRALALLRPSTNGNLLADALFARGRANLEAGRVDSVAAVIAELEATAQRFLKPLPLGYAHRLVARRAALGGDFAAARREFAEARRLLLAGGDRDLAAASDVAWAEAEVAAGDSAAALRIVDEALARLEDPSGTEAGYYAETLRARIDAAAGHLAAARERLAALGPLAPDSPAVTRRMAFLSARGALAAAEGSVSAARTDFQAALEMASRAGWRLAELELRLDLAALAPADPSSRPRVLEIERDARALGYEALAERAHRLLAAPVPEA